MLCSRFCSEGACMSAKMAWKRLPVELPASAKGCTLARRGTLCSFAAASGPVEALSPLELAGPCFTRPHMADHMRDAA